MPWRTILVTIVVVAIALFGYSALVSPGWGRQAGATTSPTPVATSVVAQATATPTTPAATTSSQQLGCADKDVGAVQAMIGLNVVCLGTEYDAYTWRSVPVKVNANVPEGWIATLHLSNGEIVVTEKQGTYEIVAGTFRRKAGYPSNDAVHNACELLRKEQAFGASQRPSFTVSPLGFTCDGVSGASAQVQPSAPSSQPAQVSGLACPATPAQASSLIGGNALNWSVLPNTDNTGWKYGPRAPLVTLIAPSFGRLDAPSGSFRNGQTTVAGEATFWCNG